MVHVKDTYWVMGIYDQMGMCLESDDDDDESLGDLEEEESEGELVVEWRPSGPQTALGEWEKHTTVSLELQIHHTI